MSASVLYMSMSARRVHRGSERRTGQPRRRRLRPAARVGRHAGRGVVRPSGPAAELFDEMNAIGAVLAGRRTAEQVDHWGGDHHGHGVPIFVPSHRPPGPSVANYPLVTYVTDGIVSAMAQAKAAAGDRDVLVHGAYTAQRALEAGVLDELQIHQVPVLFGGGRRLFERVAVARRAGDRPGDRHAGGHPHPLQRPSLSRAPTLNSSPMAASLVCPGVQECSPEIAS